VSEIRDQVYWMQTIPEPTPEPLVGHVDVDVAVVGAGFTGLSTAYHVKQAEPSTTVAVFDAESVGFGASGRNGGFNMTLFGLTMPVTAVRFGKAKAKEAHLYMERAVDTTRDLIEDLELDCDYEHTGFLRVATSEKYEKRIRHDVKFARDLGLTGIDWLDADELADEVRSPLYRGAWWEPRCGILNPAKLSFAWAGVLRDLGVAIYEGTPITDIRPGDPKAILTTPQGAVTASKVVLATNAYSHLIRPMRFKQAPVWTHIVMTEPLDDRLAEIGWENRQGIEDARDLVHYYRLTADNRLVMGGRDVSIAYGENMDRDLNEATFRSLEKDTIDTFPSLEGVRFTHRWGGPVSVTLDMAPAIGFLGDRQIAYSIGALGHGVSLTHLNGATLADLVLERDTDLTDVFFVDRRIVPFPPEPLRFAVSQAIRGYLRAEDRLYDPKP